MMKRFFFNSLILMMLTFSACALIGKSDKEAGASKDASEADGSEINTTIQFASTEHDFGQVREGDKVVGKFELVNTGEFDLHIHNVRASCGCTSPKYDKKPIRPGGKGVIEVTFNTTNRPGQQRNSVIVIANTEPSNTVLTFTCEVIPKN